MSLQSPHPSTPRMVHVAATAHALGALLLVVGRALDRSHVPET